LWVVNSKTFGALGQSRPRGKCTYGFWTRKAEVAGGAGFPLLYRLYTKYLHEFFTFFFKKYHSKKKKKKSNMIQYLFRNLT
jgi:hypothetical protein